MVRRAVFDKVGLFDPDFFFLKEDDEFCERARAHGFRIGLVASAEVAHSGSASSDFGDCSSVGFLAFHVARSRIVLARKLRQRQFPQAVMALYETARLGSRATLEAHVVCPNVVREMLTGLCSGARARLSPPPHAGEAPVAGLVQGGRS
jgi:GT2 family glycosyltransferase